MHLLHAGILVYTLLALLTVLVFLQLCHAMFIATVHSCRLLREKPNSSQIALENMVLYKRNKTADWLKTKRDEEKKMFQACIKVGQNQRMIYKQRNKELVSHWEKKPLEQREQCLAHECEKEREKKNFLICKQIWSTENRSRHIFKSCKDD